jgi:TolB protein
MRRLPLQELSSWETFIQTLAWSPDGEQLAVVGLMGSVWGSFVADLNTGDLRQVSDTAGAQVVWSPDGRLIALNAFGDNRGLQVVSADGSDPQLLSENSAWMGSQAWSPDGRQLVYSTFDGIQVVTIGADGIAIQPVRDTGYLPAWSPNGDRIAFVESDTNANLYIMSPDGSDVQQILPGGDDWYIYDLAWSPDGRWLALESECHIGGDEFVLDLCLYIVSADGSDARRIPIQTDPQFAGRFVWWP